MIRIGAVWLCSGQTDLRMGMDSLLARVIRDFGAARQHHAYLFANASGTRLNPDFPLAQLSTGLWRESNRQIELVRGVPHPLYPLALLHVDYDVQKSLVSLFSDVGWFGK